MRTEKDKLGRLELQDNAYYGIHSLRSYNNFIKSSEHTNPYLLKAYLQVKKAAAETNYKCGILFKEKFDVIDEAIDNLLDEVEEEIQLGESLIYEKFIVDPYQGGAGTSLNMNVNEVIANTALELMNKSKGDYNSIHPIDDVNMSQSTNDTYPTALKVASIYLIRELAEAYAQLQHQLQKKEEDFKGILKLGRTQFQDAVPISLGQEFGAYAQAFSRDRWRLYNAEERLRSVNMGGTAIGNSISAPKDYILNVNSILKKITKLPIAKAEDLIDATQNFDVFVEVHGIVKAGAVSIIKMCNDLRFLSSGPHGGIGEITLPPMQTGSSIMPGKVNPVILENSIQIAELVKGHDSIISNLAASGNLELNAFGPMIAHLFLKSLQLLKFTVDNLADKCIEGINANHERCKEHLINSSALAASLINSLGYDAVQEIVRFSEEQKMPFIKALIKSNLIEENELRNIFSREIGFELD